MGGFGGNGRWSRIARLLGLGAGCLALANCSSGLSGRVDPKYGVAASARVVAPGQPVPKGGGVYRVGKPYMVGGREYVPHEDANYRAVGMASWYGDDFHGRYTANGEIFDMNSLTAAHPTLPLPSYVRVTNITNAIARSWAGQRPRALCRQPRHRRVGEDGEAIRVRRRRAHQSEGRICRARAAGRLRRPQADGDTARRRAGHGPAGTGSFQPAIRA